MEALEIGARVARCNSPADSLVKDGAVGVVTSVLQAANGELGYFVNFAGGWVFCAGTRLALVIDAN